MGEIGHLFNLIFTFPIYNGLMLLFYLFHDFGLSIIVLTVVIKLILFPLTLQQLKSMKANQALQPEMAKIRKKYANDRQAQALAMQQLFKEYGVNPASGCLPLLVQLPVLYGLFYALNTMLQAKTVQAVNEHLYPFIPHFSSLPNINLTWFTFLNEGWYISLGHPDPTHILPILAGVVTFVQLRMSQPKTPPGTPSDPNTQTMKTMQYVMPFVTVFIGWTFPAGLALYWTVSSIFQAVQQYFVTGWGSLLTTPTFKKELPSQETSEARTGGATTQEVKNRGEQKQRDRETDAESADAGTTKTGGGPIASRMHNTNHTSNSSQYSKRRKPGSSASARRRSTQKSRR
ncbi:MAG: membrane protein insertase YidC [Ktedonobacteraceae bacterium]|nr:membrane protein insertase YidC [Ktedonobacteraceae bacterium]